MRTFKSFVIMIYEAYEGISTDTKSYPFKLEQIFLNKNKRTTNFVTIHVSLAH
jgi:hypothetical protein